MKHHSFNQKTVLKQKFPYSHWDDGKKWDHFMSLCSTYHLKVRGTRGNFLTHDINCDEDTFLIILDLLKE